MSVPPIVFTILANVLRSKIFWAALAITSIYAVYKYQDYRIESLLERNKKLEAKLEESKHVIEKARLAVISMQELYESVLAKKSELDVLNNSLYEKNRKLEDTLNRERVGKRKLEELARKKSKLVEKAINNGTFQTMKCFELLTRGEECL